MEHKYIPKFMVAWTFYAWRFVAGAFGKKVERPWREQLCGPFWLSLLGVTAGLPVVLLAYVIKLLFGAGRAEKFYDALEKALNSKTSKWIFGSILIAAVTYIAVVLVMLFIDQPLEMLLATLALAGSIAIVFGFAWITMFAKRWHDDSIFEEVRFNNPAAAKKKVKTAKAIRMFALVIFSPLIFAGKIVSFIAYMVWAVYKKFCPIVEYK